MPDSVTDAWESQPREHRFESCAAALNFGQLCSL